MAGGPLISAIVLVVRKLFINSVSSRNARDQVRPTANEFKWVVCPSDYCCAPNCKLRSDIDSGWFSTCSRFPPLHRRWKRGQPRKFLRNGLVYELPAQLRNHYLRIYTPLFKRTWFMQNDKCFIGITRWTPLITTWFCFVWKILEQIDAKNVIYRILITLKKAQNRIQKTLLLL